MYVYIVVWFVRQSPNEKFLPLKKILWKSWKTAWIKRKHGLVRQWGGGGDLPLGALGRCCPLPWGVAGWGGRPRFSRVCWLGRSRTERLLAGGVRRSAGCGFSRSLQNTFSFQSGVTRREIQTQRPALLWRWAALGQAAAHARVFKFRAKSELHCHTILTYYIVRASVFLSEWNDDSDVVVTVGKSLERNVFFGGGCE